MSLTVGSYGPNVRLLLFTDYDLQGATITLTLTRPDRSQVVRSGGEAVPGSQSAVVEGVTYPAYRWLEYALQSGDLNQAGTYSVQAVAAWTSPTKQIPALRKTFVVAN